MEVAGLAGGKIPAAVQEAPPPIRFRSKSVTRSPRRRASQAMLSPITPPPSTMRCDEFMRLSIFLMTADHFWDAPLQHDLTEDCSSCKSGGKLARYSVLAATSGMSVAA